MEVIARSGGGGGYCMQSLDWTGGLDFTFFFVPTFSTNIFGSM